MIAARNSSAIRPSTTPKVWLSVEALASTWVTYIGAQLLEQVPQQRDQQRAGEGAAGARSVGRAEPQEQPEQEGERPGC